MNARIVQEARRHWDAGRALDAGRVVYEAIPPHRRPLWAARVLRLVCELIPPVPEINAVLSLAAEPARWANAHDAFRAMRRLTLQVEGKDPLREGVLFLAENVAKVTYNAAGCPAPFDADAGWWIAQNVHFLAERLGDPEFERRAWEALVDDAEEES
jgi:hypothetical protein